jgi:HPt (histidine-containing phosphotransfer) domain-containing protein
VEQIERGEAEAMARIEIAFADVERRQVEKLQRSVAREAERFSEAAGHQFDGALRAAREEAAARLSRELDRAVESFVRQADAVFAERLAQTGDKSQQRIEARLRQAQNTFERQREELVDTFTRRIAEADTDLRRMLGALVAEAEAERENLESRLADLARRIDDAHAGLRPR